MRVLDEVAEALLSVGGQPRFMSALDLPLEPKRWIAVQRFLACPLPLLEPLEEGGFLPVGIDTVWDLVDHVARFRSDLEPPTERTEAALREAQIFVEVRRTLVETCWIGSKEVTREARLKDLLGD
jgi:hypothetical protein